VYTRSKISPMTWKLEVRFGPPTPKKKRTDSPVFALRAFGPTRESSAPLNNTYVGCSSIAFCMSKGWSPFSRYLPTV
jgi:hypothetical protein